MDTMPRRAILHDGLSGPEDKAMQSPHLSHSLSEPIRWLCCIACLLIICAGLQAQAAQLKTVFVIAFENHNWKQPGSQKNPTQISGNNTCAPFINSLVTRGEPNAAQVSYADNYLNRPGIHPSGANYIWAEAGSNLGAIHARADHDPFAPQGTNQDTSASLSNYLQKSGKTWRSYQEDIDINYETNQPLLVDKYIVPLKSRSGSFSTGTNEYNGSRQYGYAAKHNPPVHFTTTNGGNDPSAANPHARNYAPLQRLEADLNNDTVANYNWITPNVYNDMHSPLAGGFILNGIPRTRDCAQIAQGDNFLAKIVPLIQKSRAYKDEGVIILWWDETEGGDDASHKLPEIVISPEAKGNAYPSNIRYTHSSDLLTMQKIFNVGPCLRDACNANDLADLFRPGAIPDRITNNVSKD